MSTQKAQSTQKKPDTIIHLGAGRCRELPRYQESGASRIILAEADPEISDYLQKQYRNAADVVIEEAAVAAQSHDAVLRKYNIQQYNSLRRPAKLAELFPGLRIVDEIEVVTISVNDFIDNYHLSKEDHNWLVIDLPGEERDIASELCSSGTIHFFDQITMYCGKEGLYEDNVSADQVLEILRENGFDSESVNEEDDFDRPFWELTRNTLKLENHDLMQRVSALEKQVEELKQQKAKAEQTAERKETLSKKHINEKRLLRNSSNKQTSQIKELTARVQELLRENEQKETEITELQQSLNSFHQDNLHYTEEISEKNTAIKKLEEQVEQISAENNSRKQRADALNYSLNEQKELAVKQSQTIDELTAERNQKNDQIHALEVKAAELQKKLSALQGEKTAVEKILNEKLDECSENIIKLKSELGAEKEARESSENKRIEKVEALIKLEAKLEKTEIELSEKEKKIAILQEEKVNTQTKNTEMQSTIKKLNDQLKLAESENAELISHQSIMQEEMRKAEGQIDLIKDLLLRERGS